MESRVDPIEAETDAQHRQIAALIRRDPSLIAEAQAVVDRWIARSGGEPLPAWLEWKDALAMLDAATLVRFLESTTPRARRMRISSPFFALLRKDASG